MKRLFFTYFVLLCMPICLADSGLKGKLNDTVQKLIPKVQSNNQVDHVGIAKEIQRWIFIFVGMIAVGYIIYIGTKLLWAEGNSEELKNSMKGLAYVIVGLAVIPFAYFLVQLIVNLRVG